MKRLAPLAVLACMTFTLHAQQTWTLDNSVVRKTVAFTTDYGLEVTNWSDLTSKFNFVSPSFQHHGYNEFQFTANGQQVSGKATDVAFARSHEDRTADGTEVLDLTFTAKHVPIAVTVHYELAKDAPAVRQYLSIVNTGRVAVVLHHMTVGAAALAPGPERDLIAFGGYGAQPRETYFTGRVNDVAVLLENARTGIGFAALSEVPGYLKRTELGQIGWTQWVPAFAAMYDTDLFPFERTVVPGETFNSAAVSVLFYQRGTAADPHWRIPEYVRDHIAHDHESKPPNWVYNTWEPFHRDINADLLEAVIPKAAASGITLITLDDGWQVRYGDNDVDPKHFPKGLEPVFAQVDALGMKRGLWAPLALIDTKAHDFVAHPEWACREPDGNLRISNGGSGVVMSLASPYKFAAIDRISSLVSRYHLNYVKLDLTTVFNTYGEQPGCFEKRDEYQTSQESSVRIYEALNLIAQELHKRFPALLIDYSFEMWGEKHLIDYGLLRVADLDWISNIADQTAESAGPLQARTLLYQRAMAIPAETILIGNLQAETPNWQDRVATAMAAGPLFLGDLRKLPESEPKPIWEWISRYSHLRASVSLTDSFFPLGSWQQPRADAWDGYARLARSGEGLLVLFRNESKTPVAELSIPGFPDGTFRFNSWTDGKAWNVQGNDLRKAISVPFDADDTVQVIEIRRQ
ncbi:MAG TPA: alpha-galactosidase [Acidobacteriaceae bacterium]